MIPEAEPIACTTPDGWLLRGEARIPARPRAVAVLVHAMMVNRRTMDRPRGAGLASALAAEDIAALSFDLRGHGESGPTAREGASYTYDDFVTRDLPALVGHARTAFPELPVALVGHSLGGHAGLFAAARFPSAAPDGIVAIAANLWLPSLEPSRARRLLKKALFETWLRAAKLRGYFDPRPLRAGTDAEALAYIQQFVDQWRADRCQSADGRVDYRAALGQLAIPVLSVASSGDTLLAHPEAVARFLAPIDRSLVTLRVVRDGEAGARAPGHMGLVTEASSRPVWGEIAAWILGVRRSAA